MYWCFSTDSTDWADPVEQTIKITTETIIAMTVPA